MAALTAGLSNPRAVALQPTNREALEYVESQAHRGLLAGLAGSFCLLYPRLVNSPEDSYNARRKFAIKRHKSDFLCRYRTGSNGRTGLQASGYPTGLHSDGPAVLTAMGEPE